MALLFPAFNPHDAAAITSVLASLLANEEPPRIDVSRGHDSAATKHKKPFLDRPPYDGRLCIQGRCWTRDGTPTGYHVAYVCSRFGRVTVPVNEWPDGWLVGSPLQYDAPIDEVLFAPLPPSPYDVGSDGDGWREAYDTALAALS